MAEWVVEVTRTVPVVVHAGSALEAMNAGLAIGWEWLPEQAEGGDQGSAHARIVIVRAGDLPGDSAPRTPDHEGGPAR